MLGRDEGRRHSLVFRNNFRKCAAEGPNLCKSPSLQATDISNLKRQREQLRGGEREMEAGSSETGGGGGEGTHPERTCCGIQRWRGRGIKCCDIKI